ncbi:hypothetical protein L3Q82_009248 [Scortum barcoo]|uniref:Uncharacterized protein n=1 Tax=Scortum barcoo TaxID=214431 RepID=A0ACB8WI74_9TELE|nr:hypothetical protein L3Q82_009248 [Scortum barcoo]
MTGVSHCRAGLNDKSYGEIAVFQTIIKNSTCQGKYGIQLMNATLDVYRQIFSTILHDNTMPLLNEVSNDKKRQMIKNLRELQHEMATVQRQLDAPRRNKEELIRRLSEIQVGIIDLIVQMH